MKSDATYAGDPRHLAEEVLRLRERVTHLRQDAQEDYARAERAEAELVKAKTEIEWLKAQTDTHALTEFTKALRRRQRGDL